MQGRHPVLQRGVPAAGDGRRRGQREEEVVQAAAWRRCRREGAGAEVADHERPADDPSLGAVDRVLSTRDNTRTRARQRARMHRWVSPGFVRNFPHYYCRCLFRLLGASSAGARVQLVYICILCAALICVFQHFGGIDYDLR